MNLFIDTTVEPALRLLAEWSLRWTVLIGVYAAWLVLFRPRRAATRYLVGLGVLLACLLLTAGPRWGPGFARGSVPTASASRLDETPLPVVEPIDSLDKVNYPSATSDESPPDPTSALLPEPPRAESIPETRTPEPLGSRRLLCLSLASLYVAGVVLFLLRLGIGFGVLGRLRYTAEAASAESLRLLAACRAELGLSRRVTLAVHPRVRSPITLGLFCPTVLVPPTWSELPEAARRGSLFHELAHLVRHDDWTALVVEFIRAGFFFHPLLHWLLARLERDRELLCDETAVAHGVAPAEYARMLVTFARHPGRLRPGVSLPVGSPRTVHIRIHHLLEDTMDRSWKPFSKAGAVALGLAVVGLAVGLGSFRVRAIAPASPPSTSPAHTNQVAEEPPPAQPVAEPKAAIPADPKPPAVQRERLTYGGKTFAAWLDVMQTELKPESRIEAIKALGAFGQHGYGPEPAAAIVDLMKGYDAATWDNQDRKVIEAACQVLGKIGSSALPILLKEMKDKNQNNRRFAFTAVKYIDDFKQIRPALVAGLGDTDPWIRRQALDDLCQMVIGDYSQGFWKYPGPGSISARQREGVRLQQTREVVPTLIQALKDRDDKVRNTAINWLSGFGNHDPAAISALIKATKDQSSDNRHAAYFALSNMGIDAKTAGSLYLDLLKEKNKQVRREAMGQLGQQAKEAVPALIQQLTSGPKEDQALVVNALALIGSDARAAVPALFKLAEAEKNPIVKSRIDRAINSIQNDTRPRVRRSPGDEP